MGPFHACTEQKNLHLLPKDSTVAAASYAFKAYEIKKNLDGCEVLFKEAFKHTSPLTPIANSITELLVKIPLSN